MQYIFIELNKPSAKAIENLNKLVFNMMCEDKNEENIAENITA